MSKALKTKRCDSCVSRYVNGVYCHEIGCPKSKVDTFQECGWCGCRFVARSQTDTCCSKSCSNAYHG